MYDTYNKSNIFYVYNHYTNTYSLIGDKEEFINYIAKNIKTYNYKDSSRWNISLLEEQNVTMQDTITNPIGYWEHPEYVKCLRQKTFFDGYYRIIDIRNYLDDVIDYFKQNKTHYKKYYPKSWNSRHYHSGYQFKHKMPKTFRTRKINSIPEHKKFVRRRDKEFPNYWDDTNRRISCNWKDQYKCKKQWGHKNHLDKNNNSIKQIQDVDNFDMDLLLEEDFLNNY